MDRLHWGILATGNIANAVVQDLQLSHKSTVGAVASRSADRAQSFAQQHGIETAYASYQQLFEDPDIDIIYIATPHSEHVQNTINALEAGKHVLCEKPLALNEAQASRCFELAAEKRLFLMEALWMRFFPVLNRVEQWLKQGLIGKVHSYSASFCLEVPYDANHRLYKPKLGGGALLDLGIYPLSLATWLFGEPEHIEGTARLSGSGVDLSNDFSLHYADGMRAVCQSSVLIKQPEMALIQGSTGEIKIEPRFFCPSRATLNQGGQIIGEIDIPTPGNGYGYEITEVESCLLANRLTSDRMPPPQTLLNMRLMDQLRANWGLKYPGD